MPKTNLAYSLNLNVKRKELKSKEHSPIKRVRKKQIPKIKPVFYIFLIVVASVVLSFYLTYLVRGSELTTKINYIKKQYEIQKSETVRLQSILETSCLNAVEIEKYAKLNLRMRKQNSNQIFYINSKITNSKNIKNSTNNNKNKNSENENMFSKLRNYFKSLVKIG